MELGITPACAGKSSAPPRCIRRSRDHPRVCGEKQKLIFEITMESRITPAYAGKRDRPRSGPGTTRDHPRVCGEKCLDGIAHGMIAGSPPRVRGKGNLSGPFYSRSGITPACAGKRVRQHRRAGGKRDHPRVCGEKGSRYREIIRSMGSPPRVRGKDAVLFYMADPVGITPACAGKSRFQSRPRPVAGDHPRVCGEKNITSRTKNSELGSPPRVRGKASSITGYFGVVRITPACAGKSRFCSWLPAVEGDHPRVCGEKSGSCPCCCLRLGSPPRVRGKV